MKNLNKKFVYAIVSIVLIVVFVIIGIIIKNSSEVNLPTLTIDNFSEYFPKMGNKESTHIFQKLYEFVSATIDEDIETPDSGALIRENTIGTLDDYTTVIVDIDSIKLSLLLEVKESSPTEYRGVMFMCPDKKDIIYEDMYCSIYNDEGFLNVLWEHSYMIDNMIQTRLSGPVKQLIEDFVLSQKELDSAPKGHDVVTYVLTINEQSYINYSMKPITYSVTATVDDGRNYSIYINANVEDDICAVYITNNSTNTSSHAIFMPTNAKNVSLENWIRSLPGGESVNINYVDL